MAASAAEEKAEAAGAQAAAGGGLASKIVPILSIVNTLVTIGMIVVLFLSLQKEKKRASVEDIVTHSPAEGAAGGEHGKKEGEQGKPAEGAKKASNFGKMISLDQFTVNLTTPGSVTPKYVRVNISLEVPTEDTETEVNSKIPQIRNVIIDLFNSKRPADLATAEGRDYLKEEIRGAINSFMVTGKVKGVFFTNFAVAG